MVTLIYDPQCTSYGHKGHPERPERVAHSAEKLQQQSELALTWIPPGPCTDEAILRAHIPDHLARLAIPKDFDPDTPHFEGIQNYARASAGAALKGLDLVRGGQQAFSLMRPPGHHATRARAMGFCYLNNAAIVVLQALALGVERVAVLDFDVHHGNGTEAILQDVPGTAFFSIHQFPCYPGTGTRNVGSNCFNYPLPPQTHRTEYMHVFGDALEHVKTFNPSLLVVSAGFDTYTHDPLAQQKLEIEDYHSMGSQIRNLKTPTLHLLEGGYSEELPELIFAYLKGIDGV